MRIEIPNWSKYNPRTDVKHTTWFRLENTFWADQVLFGMDNDAKMVWISLLAIASTKMSGTFEVDPSFISANLRITTSKVLSVFKDLKDADMIKEVTSRRRNVRVTSTCAPENVDVPPPTYGRDGRDGRTNEDSEGSEPPDYPRYLKIASWFQNEVIRANPMAKRVKSANLKKWANDIRSMMTADKITEEELAAVATFALLDTFWLTVVQSPANLRKNWDKITVQMINPPKPRGAFRGNA